LSIFFLEWTFHNYQHFRTDVSIISALMSFYSEELKDQEKGLVLKFAQGLKRTIGLNWIQYEPFLTLRKLIW